MLLVLIFSGLGSAGQAQNKQSVKNQEVRESGQAEEVKPFNENANAAAEIDSAILKAKKNGKNVLLLFGANWCPWSCRLYTLFRNNDEVKKILNENFELVLVDLGHRDRNMDIDEKYDYPNELGLPALVVLNSKGEMLHSQDSGSLEFPPDHQPKGHDPKLVSEFLKSWPPEK